MIALRLLLLGGAAAIALQVQGTVAAQTGAERVAGGGPLVIPATEGETDLNPTSRTVTMTVPMRESGRVLGDVVIDIAPDDRVSLSGGRVLDLLADILDRKTLSAIRAQPVLTPAILAAAGVILRYNPQDLALDAQVALDNRASRDLQVSSLDRERVGSVIEPARFSASLTGRANFDYLHGDGGFASPVVYLDGAARLGSVVAEGDGLWRPGGDGPLFFRGGSRLVYDDQDRLMRWTIGDLEPLGRGFQSVPQIAGLSVFRSYGVLEPQRIARPRGARAFALSRPSTIEVTVNGQLVRRLQLEPGNYDLRDFPFAQGSNDIRLTIRDDAGRLQQLNFNVFLDQNQLGSGLTEFGAYAGLLASSGLRGPQYSRSPSASGFVRHGFSDQLTLGANAQADSRSQMGGLEGIWSSPLGTFGTTTSLSHLRGHGVGSATLVTFQRLVTHGGQAGDSLNLFVERRSRNFGALGTLSPFNPFAWEAGGGYSRAISSSVFAGIDGRYSSGRDDQPTVYNARATVGWRASDRLNLAAEARWEKDNFDRRLSGLLTATMRLGPSSNLRADYDTRFDRARLSYSTFRGYGVGAYNITADLDRSNAGSGANVTANYVANRAELGFSHFGSFENLFTGSLSQRSSMRVAGSLALADGAVSVGRPITDSFAVVRGHPSLKRASVEVERSAFGYIAQTGKLGTAVHPSLSSYIDRTITVDVPDAPVTVELGQGSFRAFPPYRSGYLLTVGSANNVTAVGRLVDRQGQPLLLVSGSARLVGRPQDEPISLFTNRDGRFGATGLGPGRWQVVMNDNQGSTFIIVVPKDAEGILTLGDLKPAAVPQEGK